ncbi:MAG: hypothetical protein AB1489_01090 [Acidobacteriota bacterium]
MKKCSITILTSIVLLLVAAIPSYASHNYRRRPSKTRTILQVGAGTALGAGLGAAIGGGRGAAAGALLGGGTLGAYSLARRNSGYSSRTRTIATVASGAALGTGLGAAIGGGKGAGIGALLGTGGSTIYALTRNNSPRHVTRNYPRRCYSRRR